MTDEVEGRDKESGEGVLDDRENRISESKLKGGSEEKLFGFLPKLLLRKKETRSNMHQKPAPVPL